MRSAFGKLQGTVARVHTGQVTVSIRTKLQNKDHVIEALRRAKFKFPSHQKIHISKKWEFTKFNADEFENMMAEKRLILDGYGVKYIPNHGPRTSGGPCTHERLGTVPSLLTPTNKSYFPVKKKKKEWNSDTYYNVREL